MEHINSRESLISTLTDLKRYTSSYLILHSYFTVLPPFFPNLLKNATNTAEIFLEHRAFLRI